MNLLEKIIEDKHNEIERRRQEISLEYLKSAASIRPVPPDFCASLRARPVGLIAEIKRRSPSAGTIREDFRVDHVAAQYEEAGAGAISVLMDSTHFGALELDFVAVRDAVNVPLLYKEFVLYDWQVWHAASLGASAVLLIAAVLDDEALRNLMKCAASAGLTPLVEVHSAGEMERVCALGASCIGINNRDLTTFKVSLDTSVELLKMAPAGAFVISESGIRAAADVLRVQAAGAGGVLVGEHLLRQPDVKVAIQDLMGSAWASS
jgi:indole-3-glycerol phosphate synthase